MTRSLPSRLARDLDRTFPELIDVHGSMVLTLAARLTDPTTGQDITQEVFLRAYRALLGYTEARVADLELRPWLATITRNLVRNEYRRRERRATVPLSANDGLVANSNDAAVEAIETQDRLNTLLEEMTDPQREAVVLRHIVGLPMREVALTMACPEGTAKSHVSRGLDRLRDRLATSTSTKGDRQ